ncbi:MAG: phosphate/phosphite/phosphonate ABC transporter substrate-binding protein [Chloroflexi bacterium]|nr:phosphate/phosphite/phosphonate ABC transporter substrate-binding protein [Chloroflexota bacterium]MBI2975592.1 phosphate/phosphite/phosphonate ABC transporter substrate-binding protein [Chloroflexota bacterium]MBI5291972.1 phosphate/phosphite/phosphonate ABC transporter substrate-binding protein [Chloroflexota bacterium]
MRLLISLIILLLFTGCGFPQESTAPVIDLSDLQPLPASSSGETVPLRVAVAAVISPKGTAESYKPLLDYLSGKLDRPVELVQRRTYAEVNDLIESGFVDMAFVCTSAYVDGREGFGMELLAAPQVNGETVYYSLLIVPKDSAAQSMADLRGKVFAFTDPMSNTGRLYPTFLVQQLGSAPDQFFARTFFTYSHDDAIRAVADGLAAGAAVDSLVYDFAVSRDPSLAERVQVIHRSPPFGIPPVVVGPGLRPQLKAELQSVLLAMDDDAEGRKGLEAIGVERFVLIDDSAYASVRDLVAAVGPVSP